MSDDVDIKRLEEAADKIGSKYGHFFEPGKKNDAPYEPARSTQDATLWLRRWHPERLEAWLNRHQPELRTWLNKRTPPR